MKTNLNAVLILAIVAVLFAGASAWADEEHKWVAADGHSMTLHASADMMFIGEGEGDAFDLGDLADGETRTFGEGAKQVTVTRDGDIVTIEREEADAKKLELQCEVDQDTCQIMTFSDDPEKVMIIVKKTRECVHGVGDCEDTLDLTLDQLSGGDAKVHAIVRKVKCDDAGNCEETEDVVGHGDMKIITDFHGDQGAHANVMVLRGDALHEGKVLMRCPEGDSTVHVDAEEAEDTFLCPKHSVPMEKASMPKFIHKIEVKED